MKNMSDGSRDSSKVRMIDVMCKAFLAWLHMGWGLTIQLFHNAYIYTYCKRRSSESIHMFTAFIYHPPLHLTVKLKTCMIVQQVSSKLHETRASQILTASRPIPVIESKCIRYELSYLEKFSSRI